MNQWAKIYRGTESGNDLTFMKEQQKSSGIWWQQVLVEVGRTMELKTGTLVENDDTV